MPRPQHTASTRLHDVAARAAATGTAARLIGTDLAVAGVTAASAATRPGDLFAAVPGARAHGITYVEQALAGGAVAVLTDADGAARLPDGVPAVVVGDVRAVLGAVSAGIYGDPSAAVPVLGVTGTSGKTTTTYLIRAGLAAAGRTPALIGTVGTLIGDEEIKTGFTTPEAPAVQALLAVMVERGATDVAMEVSSHALAQRRVDGIAFAAAGFTNLSEDHLDFHDSMQSYFEAKARLFEPGRCRTRAVVVDDRWGRLLAERISADAGAGADPMLRTVATSPGTSADWTAGEVLAGADGSTTFEVSGPGGLRLRAGCAIPGRYNVANALLALAMLDAVGVDVESAAPAVAAATVPGRMEPISVGQPFLAVVDYSHKPAAVAGALAALRPLTRGRLIVVLGCGGDRDRVKRPQMGQIAARGADLLIVTDDNPRSEDPAAIRRAMLDGARGVPADRRGEVREVGDRREAIRAAVAAAAAGDTVLVAGKGHETGQEVDGVVLPFDDREVLRAALSERPGEAR